MRYYPMHLAPVVNQEVGIPLECLRVNLDEAVWAGIWADIRINEITNI